MEDDDEFGDLYTDVLRPLTASQPTQNVRTGAHPTLQSRPIDPDIDSDDEEILHGVADPKKSISSFCPDPGQNSNASILEKTLPGPETRPELGGFSLNFDSNTKATCPGGDGLRLEAAGGSRRKESSGGFNFMEDEDDLNIVVEERENKDDAVVENDFDIMDKQEESRSLVEQGENIGSYPATGPSGETGPNQMIPGLSSNLKSHAGPNFEDEWESDDSEDDLQIVLNDSHHRPMGMERMPGMDDEDDEEDGDQLVIVADNSDMAHHHQQMLEERELGVEEGGPTADGENKEPGDAAKAGGAQPKIGYSNHLYHHHPFHSQFKYVRPGAAPLPGGIQGQVRPPVSVGPVAGRGRGDWRPRGPVPMQKGLHPGYGMPGWGPNTAGRGYGSGLDFTLPSHKTIFEVDIDGFEEKPWRLPGIDMSDFFNFGLNEEGWKDYCKQLEQLRLETTMQSKIRVYESGRMEQDYDPDLPPELAAAVGNHDVPSENGNAGTGEAGPSDLARASARALPPVLVGRPIPVETGSGDRLPSIDTRRPRMHDSDAIIEIVCQGSNDDDDMAEQIGNDVVGEDVGGVDNSDVVQGDDAGHIDHSSHAYKGQKREIVERREELVSRDEIGREGGPHKERITNGRGQVRSSTKTNPSDDNAGEKQVINNRNESFDSEDVKQNSPLSSDEGEPAVAIDDDDINDDSVMDDEKILDTERENYESENSKSVGRAGFRDGGDHKKIHEDEVPEDQHHRPRPGSDVKRRAKEDEDGMRGRGHREREDSHPWGGGTRHVKGESMDHWRKRERAEDARKRESERDNDSWRGVVHERDVGSGVKQRDRDELVKTRTEKLDDAHGKRRKDGTYADRERGLEKEEKAYNHRESSRRKRERDDAHSKSKDDDTLYTRQKSTTQPVMTGARAPEEKKWISHSRGKDEYKRSGRDYHSRSVRHGDQLKRRDRAEEDSYSRSRGREEANSRGNRQGSKDEKRAAYDRPSLNDEREVHASDASRQHEHNRQKGASRKGKEFESGERSLLTPSEGNYEDGQSVHTSEMANSRAKTKQSNPETDRKPLRKHGGEASSDEEQIGSKRGRSKFERWASHQERDPVTTPISSSLRKSSKDSDTHKSVPASVSPLKNLESTKPDLSADNKDATAKPVMDDNKHLDTVEKLKKRSERFKLPMPGGKETIAVKKMESEPPLPSAQTEARPDSEIKPERPARKRRWTGN